MRASAETYNEVANHCSQYEPKSHSCTDCGCASNSTLDNDKISCTNCKHFTSSHYCDINLYDEIVKERHLADVKEQ